MRTAWGTLLLEPTETRLASPYFSEPLEVAIVARLPRPGMTAIDIGANRGWFTLMLAARVGPSGRVLAVEPDPRLHPRIAAVISLNSLEDWVSLHPVAIVADHGDPTDRVVGRTFAESPPTRWRRSRPRRSRGTVGGRFIRRVVDECGPLEASTSSRSMSRASSQRSLEGVLTAIAELNLNPPTLMFEYVATHWDRNGFPRSQSVMSLSQTCTSCR